VNLVNDEDRRTALGNDGREYALSEFIWPVVAQRYLELYDLA
jgi:glycosyltransferase involved in cell wall biosynthesis